jgi:dihydroneopterin aldolase
MNLPATPMTLPTSTSSCIELQDLRLSTRIGTYGPGDTVPEYHALDLTLWIDPDWVLIPEDGMAHVFDYDPLVAEIERLAADGHYETQERLMTRIVQACAACPVINALSMALRKFPVRAGSGSLGVRLNVDGARLQHMRSDKA